MKNKVIALVCLILLLVGLISCGNDVPDDKATENIEESDIVASELKRVENISDYVVVKSADALPVIKEAAGKLADAIKKATSAPIIDAVDTRKEAQYEILIGDTTRKGIDVDVSSLNNAQFIVKQHGDKIVITGGSALAIVNGVEYFIENFISEKDGVSTPAGEGVRITAKNVFTGVEVSGKDLEGYVISGNLYEVSDTYDRFSIVESYSSASVMESERLADFVAKLENATYISFSVIESEKLPEYEGNYIMLDDTNPDFSSYEIKIENGNIILYANYYSLDDCINSFFADVMGYDLDKGQITGAKSINITEGKKYKVEKSEIYTKEKLMSVLEEIYNDDSRIIIGQQMSQGVTIGEVFDLEISNYKAGCGVEPALLGWDVVGTMVYPKNKKSLESSRVKIAYQMVEYMRDGGIITLSTHFPNPLDENPAQGDSIKGDLGHEDKWDELFETGTEINTRFMGYLEQLGDFLEILDRNGAPIILRTLFESNGNWTWYSISNTNEAGVEKKLSPNYVKFLWIFIYDYLVETRGLDNIIWEYAPNVVVRGGTNQFGSVMDCYPGDEYVDIVAVDWYPSAAKVKNPVDLVNAYEDLTSSTGKIFVYGELSAGTDLRTMGDNYTFTAEDYADMLINFAEKGVKSAYALSWSSWDEAGVRAKLTMYEMTKGKEFYANNSGFLDKEATRELLYG